MQPFLADASIYPQLDHNLALAAYNTAMESELVCSSKLNALKQELTAMRRKEGSKGLLFVSDHFMVGVPA